MLHPSALLQSVPCYSALLQSRRVADFTEFLVGQGLWKPPLQRTAYDLLPAVLKLPGRDPYVYQLPLDCVREVVLTHPRCKGFDGLALRWPVVPTFTSRGLSLGGVEYRCVPFNAWHMDLAVVKDLGRYPVAEAAAGALGIDRQEPAWQLRVRNLQNPPQLCPQPAPTRHNPRDVGSPVWGGVSGGWKCGCGWCWGMGMLFG